MSNLTNVVSKEENSVSLVDNTCFLIGEFVNQWENLIKPGITDRNFTGARAVANTAEMKLELLEKGSFFCHPQIFVSYKMALSFAVTLAKYGESLREKDILSIFDSVDRYVGQVELGLVDNQSYQAGRRSLG